VQRFDSRVVLDRVRLRADANVLEQHLDDARRARIRVGGEGRQEHLILNAEVPSAVLAPELEEGVAGRTGILDRRSTQPLGRDQRDVVITGEWLQRSVSLHAADRPG